MDRESDALGGRPRISSMEFESTGAVANDTHGAMAVGHDPCFKCHQPFFPGEGERKGFRPGHRPTSIPLRSSKC